MANRWSNLVLFLILLFLTPLFIIFLVAGILLPFFFHDFRALISAGMMILLCSSCLWAIVWLWPSRRVRRALVSHLELLMPVRGRLSSEGHSYFESDGHLYWLHPIAISRARLTSHGLAVPLGVDSRRFLPVSFRLLGQVDISLLRMIVSGNREIVKRPASFKNWVQLAAVGLKLVGSGWIFYGGQQFRPRKFAFNDWTSIVLTIFSMVGVAAIVLWVMMGSVAITVLGVFICVGFSGLYLFKKYRFGVSQALYCWGAVSETQWLIGEAFLTRVYEPLDRRLIQIAEDFWMVMVRNAEPHYVFRQQVEDGEENWLELQRLGRVWQSRAIG